MSQVFRSWLLGALVSLTAAASAQDPEESFRLVSWNISGNSSEEFEAEFQAMISYMKPEILVLDEVLPTVDPSNLESVLEDAAPGEDWSVDFGPSGGRQRGLIASRWPVESLPQFDTLIEYPEPQRQRIDARMSENDKQWIRYSMEGGIPANGVIVEIRGRRLMVVSVDLQCCGGAVNDWYEHRRRVEARVIRHLIIKALSQNPVDGLVVAGDFNSVATAAPFEIISLPYKPTRGTLSQARPLHLGTGESWTWDGRGTPFPSSALDRQFYGANTLVLLAGVIFDTEDLDTPTLAELGLSPASSKLLSRHRPLVVDYRWR